MKKRRIKKSVIIKLIVLIILIIGIIVGINIHNTIEYHKTDEYKLKVIGYNKEEIEKILQISTENIEYIKENEYNNLIYELINQKYYIDKNLKTYIEYRNEKPNESIENIISIVNVKANKEAYTNTEPTDISKKELMLTNKYNYLEKDYEPENIVEISSRYAYEDNEAPKEILDYYIEMFTQAEKDGMDLIISSAYRSYEEQDETYKYYEKIKGEDVKNYAAQPGYSEHQTGLAFDILSTGVLTDDFDKTKEFEWLQKNAYKYGFILRYPKGKEKLTGYDYESWHYRYVGKEIAKKIQEEKITYDEYYAYYIENR